MLTYWYLSLTLNLRINVYQRIFLNIDDHQYKCLFLLEMEYKFEKDAY